MQLGNDARRWGAVSLGLHWLTAGLVLGMLALGVIMVEVVESRMLRFELYQWHKSFGLTLFALTLLRLGWRLAQPAPALPGTLKAYERVLARLTHAGLYALLLAMPIAGWVSTESAPLDIPTRVFGVVALPDPIPVSEPLHETFAAIHLGLAITLAAVIALHVAAAFKHHFALKDDTLARMLPLARGNPGRGGAA